ncbi:hypothetical protein [Pseudoxanthomonas suwonensis]|nr:hypothetical protein [Pseudoxanthomonas suwonensis]
MGRAAARLDPMSVARVRDQVLLDNTFLQALDGRTFSVAGARRMER